MSLNYILVLQNQKLLIHNNHVHRKEKDSDEKLIRKCNDYKKFKCFGHVTRSQAK